MQANWSLILNVLLLAGVMVAISRVMAERRKNRQSVPAQPFVGTAEKTNYDDVISVRKVSVDDYVEPPEVPHVMQSSVQSSISPTVNQKPSLHVDSNHDVTEKAVSVMIFLLAKDNRQLVGYELLQTLLAAGLRFGDGQMFHRHQHLNGQGPVLCSLAAATATGTFDLQNIGAFSVHGLCLFMQASGNSTIDAERFTIMLDTAKQLSDDLDTHLLDEQRKPFSNTSLQRYYRILGIHEHNGQFEMA
jgi:cell division protein ZipA